MKYRAILDLMVYIMAPILVGNIVDTQNLTYALIGLIATGAFYTILVKFKQDRINISAIFFMTLSLMLFTYRIGINGKFDIYAYDTYFLILCTILIPFINIFCKNICNYIYRDILKSMGYNDINVAIIIKKNELDKEFNELSSVITIHVLAVIFIRVYSIVAYGASNYLKTSDLEILISIILVMVEIYIISKIISKPKYRQNINNEKKNKNKNKPIYKQADKRVINLNQYKKVNK